MSMFEVPPAIKAITLGQILTISIAGTPLATAGYWGLNKLIKSAVAEEKFVTQEALDAQAKALDEQGEALKGLQKQFQDYEMQNGILQSDVGTVKALQKQNRDVLDQILLNTSKIVNEN